MLGILKDVWQFVTPAGYLAVASVWGIHVAWLGFGAATASYVLITVGFVIGAHRAAQAAEQPSSASEGGTG